MTRFGPRLPGLVEAALVRQSNFEEPPARRGLIERVLLAVIFGIAIGVGGAVTLIAVDLTFF